MDRNLTLKPKPKRDIKKTIMKRFILYILAVWFALLLGEFLLSLVTFETEYDFGVYVFSVTDGISLKIILLNGIWLLVAAAIFTAAIRKFGKRLNADFDESMAARLKEDEEKRAEMENERMRLFSHIAHDLKTPMTTVIGYAGALAEGLVEEPKQRECLLAIRDKSRLVVSLTGKLLAYSKLGTPGYRLNLAPTDFAELVRAVCASLFGEIEAKGMTLELELPSEPVVCNLDPLEMNRVIGNLITNAVKHNPAGSLLSVKMREEAGKITVAFADSGEAIPPQTAKEIFEPFVSGSEARNPGSGTGLGLAIVKKVMERHSGEVYITEAEPPYTKAFVIAVKV